MLLTDKQSLLRVAEVVAVHAWVPGAGTKSLEQAELGSNLTEQTFSQPLILNRKVTWFVLHTTTRPSCPLLAEMSDSSG